MRIALGVVLFVVITSGPGCGDSGDKDPGDGGTTADQTPDQPTGPPAWGWALSAGGAGVDGAAGFAVDSNGNATMAGYFSGGATFGSINITAGGGPCPPPCNPPFGMFVARLDPAGKFLWATPVEGKDELGNATAPDATAVAVDAAGNSYVTGTFHGTVSFGTYKLTAAPMSTLVFVAKLDKAGKFLWATPTSGDKGGVHHKGPAIAVDSAGNSYITGGVMGPVSFGSTTLDSSSGSAPFVAKLDPSGTFLWAVAAKAGGTETSSRSIVVDDAGSCTIAGSFDGTATFGASTLVSKGAGQAMLGDAFVARLDKDGTFLWATAAGSTGDDLGTGIGVDSAGNSYVAGIFQDGAGFDSTILKVKAADELKWDRFVAKLDPKGRFLWARAAGGQYGTGCRIVVDDQGNSTVAGGGFLANTLFGLTVSGAASVAKMFVARLDPDGTAIRGIVGGHPSCEVVGVGVDSQGNTLVGGQYLTQIEMPGLPKDQYEVAFGDTVLKGRGEMELFVAQVK